MDTAQTEAALLTDSVKRNQEQLISSENELESLDGCQSNKRRELSEAEFELQSATTQLKNLEMEDKELDRQEGALSARNKKLVVRFPTSASRQ